VFCPNCGTQNDSAAMPCKKCGFKLSGVSASKFKGTMMLNSDRTVQELIDEHRKKQAEAAAAPAADAAAAAPSSLPTVDVTPKGPTVAPLSGLPGAPKSVLQPPRAASTRRRMGGTMLGVAPQVGGVTPPRTDAAVTPSPSETGPLDAATENPGLAPPTLELTPTPTPPPASVSPTAEQQPPAAPVERQPPVASAPGVGLEVSPAVPEPAEELAPDGFSSAVGATPRNDLVDQARGARVAATTAMPAQPPASAVSEPPVDASLRPGAQRIRPFEVFLIVATCGLYGIFLLLRPRKRVQN
jgi:zinc ribbon protein